MLGAYLDSEETSERQRQIQNLAEHQIQTAHTFIVGDFNFVTRKGDRWTWKDLLT